MSLVNNKHDICNDYSGQTLSNMNDTDLFNLLDEINNLDQYTTLSISTNEPNSKQSKNNTTNINIMKNTRRAKIKCIECDTDDKLIEDEAQGLIICRGCGVAICNILDESPEWKQYSGDDGKDIVGRCGQPTNFFLPQSSIGTTIGGSNNRLKKVHGWGAMPYKERSLYLVLKYIQDKCRAANIVKYIEDDAKILYKNISECKYTKGKNKGKPIIIRGTNRKSLIASCVFYACKRNGRTRSPKEIAKVFGIKNKQMTKGCKTFARLLTKIKLLFDIEISIPEHFVPRYGHELHMGKDHINQAMKLAQNIQKLNVASAHTPFSIAISSLLLVIDINKLDISKKAIAQKFGVSKPTIVKTFKKIEQYKKICANDELTVKLVKLLAEEKERILIPQTLTALYNKAILMDIEKDKENNNIQIKKSINVKMDNLNDYINACSYELHKKLKGTEEKYNKLKNAKCL